MLHLLYPATKPLTKTARETSPKMTKGDNFDTDGSSRKRKSKRRRRLDKHSRDGRWYPSHEPDWGDNEKMDVDHLSAVFE